MKQVIFGNGQTVFSGKKLENDPIATERSAGEVRCACFIPGGIQCVLPMYHDGAHVYEPYMPFSTHLHEGRVTTASELLRMEARKVGFTA